ncbi:dUTP pyrophosphatase [Faunimonas pinastri]|uniref:Deoxyuridine 5'-triphosphate nucleotidohydrolase n=1 Tax=Faunimonas pinastri TaxID=1855383 RepID=A0A1H9MWE9_9HYPH|nr:dUTP diphosphatase [Faunimonas pinastri]SER28046.1 dUTP pyrophosphatase [Faunimonas pinastri]
MNSRKDQFYLEDVKVKRLRSSAAIPAYQTDGSAGMDVKADIMEPITINPGERSLIGTGLAFALPPHLALLACPRSGLALKAGITIVNAPGIIDSDYRGEVGIILQNTGDKPFVVEPGDRIAQIMFTYVARAILHEVEDLDETARGAGGFGSTGAR